MPEPSPQPRKPIYRTRNLVIVAAVVVAGFLSIVIYAVTRPLGKPGKYAAALERLVTERQPNEGANGYLLLMDAVEARDKAEGEIYGRLASAGGSGFVTRVDQLYDAANGSSDEDAAAQAAQRRTAILVIAELEKAGVLEKLDAAAAAPRAVRPVPTGEVWAMLLPELGRFRQAARFCGGRIMLAAESGDDVERARAFEHGLAIGRICSAQFTFIDFLVGQAVAQFSTSRLRESLIAHRPEGEAGLKLVDSCLAAMDRQTPYAPISVPLEGERLALLDAAEWTHTDDGNAGGLYVTTMESALQTGGSSNGLAGKMQPLGALGGLILASKPETIAKANEIFDSMQRLAALSRSKRSALDGFAAAESLPRKYAFIHTMLPAFSKTFQSTDFGKMDLLGTRLMLLIERHRLRTGAYPSELGDLVPGEIAELPIDPINDRPFGYRRIDPATDALGRGYVLYSLGDDATDDGGRTPANRDDAMKVLFGKEMHGYDFIINQGAQR